MPLVRIDSPNADPARLAAVGEAVHQALVAAFGIPPDDLFQVHLVADNGLVCYDSDYLGVHRDDDVVLVQVTLRRGRTEAQKRFFYAELARRASEVNVEPRNLVVTLVENDLVDWSFGDGVAQYLETAPPGPPRAAE